MLTGDEIESLPIGLEKLFRGFEKRVMRDIIRRLKAAGEITRSADWQIYRSAELGKAIDEIKKEIAETLDGGDEEVNRLFDEAAKTSWARDKKLYKSVGKPAVAYRDNETLKQLVAAVKAQTSDELRNITGTLGVATANKGRIKTVSLTEYFTDTLDNAALDISSGAFDYNTVLKRTVTELVNSGIRTINYDSVSKRPTTARVDVAARRAVMTGVNQLTAKISEDNAKTLGTDMYEVSAHSCCRPEHVEWQGGWYTMAQLKSVCGYGKVDGLKGANCGHDFDAVIPGVSDPSYTPEELKQMRAEESKKHEYNGKEYTKYEASQRQRRLERTIAARRHAVDLLEEGGADEQTIQTARASFQAVSQEYTRFSKAMGLPQQRERVGTALAGMKYEENPAPKGLPTDTQTVEIPLDKSEKSGIIEADLARYKQFDTGDEANDFFYYDGEKRGLLAKKQSKHAQWEKSLSKSENESIEDYTGGGYSDLNRYLRKIGDWQNINAEKEEFIAASLDSAIKRYELKDNITVQRGVMNDVIDILAEQNDVQESLDELVGKKYTDPGYLSTSALFENRVATSKPTVFEIEIPAGVGRGAYVNSLAGQYQDVEYEFLIKRNASFTIKEVKEEEINGEFRYYVKLVMDVE